MDCLVPRADLPTPEDLVAVGRIGRPWGVRGALTLRLYNPDSDLAWAADAVWLRGEAFPTEAVSVSGWEDKGGKVLVTFEGVSGPEDARALTHLEVLVPREDLSDVADGEHYVSDLIGMEVVDEQGTLLGELRDVFNAGASDIWVVQGEQELLLPAIREFVLDVDGAARRIRVRHEAPEDAGQAPPPGSR